MRVDKVDRAEAGVTQVMVDIDDGAGVLNLTAPLAEPPEGGAIEREDGVAERRAADLDGLEAGKVLDQARQRLGHNHTDGPTQ